MARGGARQGAGRPPKEPPAPTGTVYETAQDYLSAVVSGLEPADPVRVQAAKTLIQYQETRKRRPLPPNKTPRAQAKLDETVKEQQLRDEWAEKAQKVRARLAEKNSRR